MRASLIVLNYRGRDVIADCVESLLAASSDDDEIIVVDNACPDESWRQVPEHPRVRLIRRDQNNYIFGLNDGLRASEAEFVAFCNNDMVVEKSFVEECLAAFDSDKVMATCPRILDKAGREQGSLTRGFWSKGQIFYQPLPHDEKAATTFFAVGGQSFYRRDILEKIGSIDELFWPMYHEDIELSYRAWRCGYVIRFVPEAVVHHIGGHSSSRTFSTHQLRSFVRQNELLIVWKDVTDPLMLLQHFLCIPLRLTAALLKRDFATVVGFARAVRRIKQCRASRAQVRPLFATSDRRVLQMVGQPQRREPTPVIAP